LNTFGRNLQFAALGDLDRLRRLVSWALGHILNGIDDLVALEDLAENDVAAIEPRGNDGRDEELGAVGIWAWVSKRLVAYLSSLHTLSGVGHACCCQQIVYKVHRCATY
jgi:hypothetical protein